jgi:hypothetical protein
MVTWDYRVLREEDGMYVIREVFYEEDGSLLACTEDAVEPMGDSLKELGRELDAFKAALKQPELTLADIPKPVHKKSAPDRAKNRRIEQVADELGLAKKKPVIHSSKARGKGKARSRTRLSKLSTH